MLVGAIQYALTGNLLGMIRLDELSKDWWDIEGQVRVRVRVG